MPDATSTRPNGVVKVDQLGFEATVEVIESTPRRYHLQIHPKGASKPCVFVVNTWGVPEGSRSGSGSLTAYLKPHCEFKFRDVNKEEFWGKIKAIYITYAPPGSRLPSNVARFVESKKEHLGKFRYRVESPSP